jgi:hypothetical protein
MIIFLLNLDDEDVTDDQEETKAKPSLKSELTINEHERFLKDKEEFKRKNKEQIDDVKILISNRFFRNLFYSS